MRKFYVLSQIIVLLGVSTMVITSCKKDEPFVKPKLSFSSTTLTVNEADQTVSIDVVIDKAYTEDITIEYKLSGTAVDKITASGANSSYDYEITSEYLEVQILKGETTGAIEVKLYSDFILEDPETFEISIDKVNSENIEITRDDEISVTIEQEDGLLVVLDWGTEPGDNYTDVDMDLFLWADNDAGDLVLTNINSSRASFVAPEFMFLPSAPLPDGDYGLSCNYYEGSEDPMNFKITFIKIVNNAEAGTTEIDGIYTAANLNKWDITDIDPILVQTFSKAGADFSNFSTVDVPVANSRTITGSLPVDVIRHQGNVKFPVIHGKKN